MILWLHITLVVVFGGMLVLVLLLILQRCLHPKTRQDIVVISDEERGQNLQNGISRLHLDRDGSKKTSYHVFQQGVSAEPIFSWVDHPSLATENGWSRFAFTNFMSSPSVKSSRSLLGVCASSDHENEINVEIGWEICEGSADHMQKIRLNPGLKKIITSLNSSMGAASVIRTALPLPGPHLGNSFFPQEAYFEITILPGNEDFHDHSADKEKKDISENEGTRLIGEDINAKDNPDSLTRLTSCSHSQRRNKIEEVKLGGKKEGKDEVILLSVGFSGEGPLPLKVPGSFPGSIGFNSSGSVYLEGTNLVSESKKDEWGRAEKVIGCDYNPAHKKVFFTVDSQLVYEIHCKTDDFGSPLYPTLAANTDITLLVNLGQTPFKFAPANLQRIPNPHANSPVLHHGDSKELFSIGRIDPQWMQRSATRSNNNTVNSIKSIEVDDHESEGDLFEIVLEGTGRFPYNTTTTTYQ